MSDFDLRQARALGIARGSIEIALERLREGRGAIDYLEGTLKKIEICLEGGDPFAELWAKLDAEKVKGKPFEAQR